jgi:hypothetical protein
LKFETSSGNNFNQLLISFKIPFCEKEIYFRTQIVPTPKAYVVGYSSRTENGKYVLFHDYDNLTLKEVLEDLEYLQKRFKLSNYYIFKSLDKINSFHAVCLDLFTLGEAYDIQKASSCDLAFINSPRNLRSKEWILRLGKKGDRQPIKLYSWLTTDNNQRVKSQAHKDFLLNHFAVPNFLFEGKFDGCKNIGLVVYNTANRLEI